MADLSISFAGIRSPNPFWLASGPPTNSGDQVSRAFDLGWGGVRLEDARRSHRQRLVPLRRDRRRQPAHGRVQQHRADHRPAARGQPPRNPRRASAAFRRHAMVVSIMEDSREDWHDLIRRVEDTGADGIELNFGCPHGMCERGMGSAVGQEPKVLSEITRWAREATTLPVLVKLTPNVSDILEPGRRRRRGRRERPVAHQHHQEPDGRRPRPLRAAAGGRCAAPPTAATAGRP